MNKDEIESVTVPVRMNKKDVKLLNGKRISF